MRYLLLSIFIFVATARADRLVPVELLLGESAPVHTQEALKLARQKLRRQLGVRLKVRHEYTITEESAPERVLENFPYNLYVYWNLRLARSAGISLFVSGPLSETYFAGVASNICLPVHGLAVVFGDDVNVLKTSTVIVHEIGHLLGARHDDTGISLMNSWFEPETDYKILEFSPISKRQVARCWRRLDGDVRR